MYSLGDPLNQVYDFLFIGDDEAASSRKVLDEHNIKFVLNMTTECSNYFAKDPQMVYLKAGFLDTPSSDVYSFFPHGIAFIEAGRMEYERVKRGSAKTVAPLLSTSPTPTPSPPPLSPASSHAVSSSTLANSPIKADVALPRVLIHCFLGVSRSAAMTIAYCMYHDGLTMRRAWDLVQSKRSFISPVNFQPQLARLETLLQKNDRIVTSKATSDTASGATNEKTQWKAVDVVTTVNASDDTARAAMRLSRIGAVPFMLPVTYVRAAE